MSLNWKEIEKILSELPLEGAHIQDIRQPDFHSLVLELFRAGERWNLYIGLAAGTSRIHRLSRKISCPKVSRRFVEFLRSRVRGGRIREARQIPGDRLFCLRVQRAGEDTLLWFRLWGAASNIIATQEDGRVLDAYYRRPARGEETGGVYLPGQPHAAKKAGESAALAPAEAKKFEIRPWPPDMSFNSFIEEEYFRREEDTLAAKLRARLDARFAVRDAKICAAIAGLEKRLADYENPELKRRLGSLVLQNLHTLKKGDAWCAAIDYETGEEIEIPLDVSLSPKENAETFYQKYKKAKAGRSIVEEELENLKKAREDLAARREKFKNESSAAVLLGELGGETPGEKAKDAPPGLRFESNGFAIHVGRTAAENDELLRHYVRGNDWWLHTRDYPGAYVFIKAKPGKSVPLETLLEAGRLAVFYSKARSSGGAELYYTQVKYLRRAKGEKTGTVLPTHEKNLSVRLETQESTLPMQPGIPQPKEK